MPLPAPVPGLVIRYGYLWHSEHQAGSEEGKDRPCAIVAALRPADDPGEIRVLVLPITHSCRRLQSSAAVLANKGRFLLTIAENERSAVLTLCDPVLAIIRSCSQSSRRAQIICN